MKLEELVPVMRSLGVRACDISPEGHVLRCELLDGAPAQRREDAEPDETDEQRLKRERLEYERLLYAASEGT